MRKLVIFVSPAKADNIKRGLKNSIRILLISSFLLVLTGSCKTIQKETKGQEDPFLSLGYHNTGADDSISPVLKKMKDVHPRLFMTSERRDALKARVSAPPYSDMLSKLRTMADKLVESGPPEYKAGGQNDEQLWQRVVGNAIPELAMVYCMTGDKKYLNAAKNYMLTSISYPTWGLGNFNNSDLATGHMLFGISLGYDWLYHDLDPDVRKSVRDCLISRGGKLYDILANDRIYWTRTDLQNHQYVNMTGLFTAGLALYGGDVDVNGWILLPLKKFSKSISVLQPDGANHEGIPYWGYAVEYLMKFMDLSRDLMGTDFYSESAFFRNTASFRLYGMIPKNYWDVTGSTLMTLGDSPRKDWYGPDYLMRKLASEYNDGYAQWFADEIDKAGHCSPQAGFLNLLWFNPEINVLHPGNLPLYKHFNDLDIIYLRSGWDGNESLTLFKCGPFIGHSAIKLYDYDPGGGHVHPDVGAFQIFSHGDWLISDDEYTFKRTMYQNTLVINGIGQMGEGRMWFSGREMVRAAVQPKIVYSKMDKDIAYVIGNAGPAYPDSSGLKVFYRHMLYLQPGCWIIADEVEADRASLFEFYYHSDFAFIPDGLSTYKARGMRGSLNVTPLMPRDAEIIPFLQDIQHTSGRIAKQMNTLKISSSGKVKDLFITVMESYPTGQFPGIQASIVSTGDGDQLVLMKANEQIRFRINASRNDKNTPLFVRVHP